MTDEDSRDAAQPSREATGRPAGFFASRATIKRFLRFRALVIQREHWATHINVARPLEELIPRDTKPEHYHLAIDAAINELIHRDLTIAGVSTEFEFTGNPEWDPERKRVVHGKGYLDVIDKYFEIPHPSTTSSFNVVLSVIQRGVGVYEARKRRAFWENLNPLRWLAGLLRVPRKKSRG
jgi:hypothetical protein